MKKFCFLPVLCPVLLLLFFIPAKAAETGLTEDDFTVNIFYTLDEETRRLLQACGIDGEDTAGDFLTLTPYKVLSSFWGFIKEDLPEFLKDFGGLAGLIFLKALTDALGTGTSVYKTASAVGTLAVLFVFIARFSSFLTDCLSAVTLTEDFTAALVPVYAGVMMLSGKPQTALCFQSVTFAFSETVSYFFSDAVPTLSAILTALSAGAAINPLPGLSAFGETLGQWTVRIMGFVSALFTGVLTVRGVIAGAADTVTVKGLRFLVGSAVPVVGSALGDGLTTVLSGLKLLSGGIGGLAVAALTVINLPVLIRLTAVKIALSLLSSFCEIYNMKTMPVFFKNMTLCLSLYTGLIFFNMFTFIIAAAVTVTIQG